MPSPPCECHDVPMRWVRDLSCQANGYWRCSVRAKEQQRRYARNRRRRNEDIVAAELKRRGGGCIASGHHSGRLEWHHREPGEKLCNIGKAVKDATADVLRAELKKCDPLCRRHHGVANAAIHERERAFWYLHHPIS